MAQGSAPIKIVILGGGFAGVHTARHLQRLSRSSGNIQITLISKHNYFLLTPLLFEAGSGVLEPRHAVNPLRKMFRRVRFIEAEVKGFDLEHRSVRAESPGGETLGVEYDHLVVALGGTTNMHLIPGSEHARTFKSLYDAMALRNHCIQLLERADVEADPAKKRVLLTFAIIGGGLVGLELQGELTEFIRNVIPAYASLKWEDVHFELIEGGARLVPEMDAELGEYAAQTLKSRGVNVRVNTRVKQIEPDKVHLPDGSIIEAKTIVLSAGVITNPIVGEMKLESDKRGRLITESTMRIKDHPELWALGDCAAIPDPQGHPYPTLAQHALREAKGLAKNILAAIDHRPLAPFVYKSKGTLASLGRYLAGVGRVYTFKIHGFLAWWVWRSYYLMQMPRLERKIRIMIDWTVALVFKNDVVQLDVTQDT